MSEDDPFAFLVARGPVAGLTTGAAWMLALVDVEIALAWAHADVGTVAAEDAATVADAAERLDLEAACRAAALAGNAVLSLVEQWRVAAGAAGNAVHLGATSQDVVDTATMLVVRGASEAVAADLDRAAEAAVGLGERHGTMSVTGRTLLQHAVPMTFSVTTARWADGLGQAARELRRVAESLPVQLGGPVGDPTSFDGRWSDLVVAMARRLDLAVPGRPWHTQRHPISAIAGAWGGAAGAIGTVALDVVLLAQQEIGILAERADGAGGSSSMPHKHNPIAAVSARAAALQTPGLVATLLQCAGGHELERAAGAWHAEWPALRSLLRATGAAASWLGESFDRLQIGPEETTWTTSTT